MNECQMYTNERMSNVKMIYKIYKKEFNRGPVKCCQNLVLHIMISRDAAPGTAPEIISYVFNSLVAPGAHKMLRF